MKIKFLIIGMSVVCAVAGLAEDAAKPVSAQPVEKPKSPAVLATEPKEYSCRDGGVFRYRWHEPAKVEEGKRYPLIVLMHGSGERGTNNVEQLNWGATPLVNWCKAKNQEYYLLAGQVPEEDMWTDLKTVAGSQPMAEKPTPSMARQIELLDDLLNGGLPIDRDRVYVTGISMGGYGTWDLISRKRDWFAAAMPVCGGGDVAQMQKLKDLPIFIHHGADDRNVAAWNSRALYTALIMAGSNCVRYHEYPNCGHPSWHQAYGDVKSFEWLFAQRRHPAQWKDVAAERQPDGSLKLLTPSARYEVSFFVGVAGQKPLRLTAHRGAGFPIVTLDGRVVEGVVFGLELGDKQVVVSDPKDGCKLEYSQFAIRQLANGER